MRSSRPARRCAAKMSAERLDGHIAVVTGALGTLGPVWTAALAEFTGELDSLLGIRDWLEGLLDQLQPAPQGLRAALHELTPRVFDSSQPARSWHTVTVVSPSEVSSR